MIAPVSLLDEGRKSRVNETADVLSTDFVRNCVRSSAAAHFGASRLWHIVRIAYELRDNYVDDPDTQRMAPSLDALVSSELLPQNAGIACAARAALPRCYGQC